MATTTAYNTSSFSSALQTPQLQQSQINPLKDGLKQGLSTAGTLSTIPGVGWLAGGIGGAISGVWKGLASKGKRRKEENKFNTNYLSQMDQSHENADNVSRAQAATQNQGFYSNLYAENGGKLPVGIGLMKKFLDEFKYEKPKEIESKRQGGKMNIIPSGELHEDENKHGDKGVPVVTENADCAAKGNACTLNKEAEIEREEIIFSLELTERLEQAAEQYKANPEDKDLLIEIGTLLKYEILNNTQDNTELLKDKK